MSGLDWDLWHPPYDVSTDEYLRRWMLYIRYGNPAPERCHHLCPHCGAQCQCALPSHPPKHETKPASGHRRGHNWK